MAKGKGAFGSPRCTQTIGKGPVAGAPRVGGAGPGRLGGKVAPKQTGLPRDAAKGTTPRGMRYS